MFDILSAILYQETIPMDFKEALEEPCSYAEQHIRALLKTVGDRDTVWHLEDNIRILAREYYDEAFLSGVRFGAQLMLQLTEGF